MTKEELERSNEELQAALRTALEIIHKFTAFITQQDDDPENIELLHRMEQAVATFERLTNTTLK